MLFENDIPFTPALGINKTSCFVLAHDALANTTSAMSSAASSAPSSVVGSAVTSVTSSVASSASAPMSSSAKVTGVPKTTGTLLAAQSAVPTWDFSKIASYSSANGKLPTNVNYTQMVQATSVPANLQAAVTKAVSSRKSSSGCFRGAVVDAAVLGHAFLGIASIIALAALL